MNKKAQITGGHIILIVLFVLLILTTTLYMNKVFQISGIKQETRACEAEKVTINAEKTNAQDQLLRLQIKYKELEENIGKLDECKSENITITNTTPLTCYSYISKIVKLEDLLDDCHNTTTETNETLKEELEECEDKLNEIMGLVE